MHVKANTQNKSYLQSIYMWSLAQMTRPCVMSMQVSMYLSKNHTYSHHLLCRNNDRVYIKISGWLIIEH